MVEPVVVVHGGTGSVPEKMWNGRIEGVKAAARQSYEVSTSVLQLWFML